MNKRSGIETKKRILDASMDVFSRKGYTASNIREIAKIAKISIGTVYLYFKNKEELYQNLIENKKQELTDRIIALTFEGRPASQSLNDFIKIHLEYAVKHKEFILLHIREHGFSFGIEKKRAFFNQQISIIEKIIKNGINSGEFMASNPADTARIIMGTIRGIILTIALDNINIKPKALSDFILCALLKNKQDKHQYPAKEV